MTYREYLRGKNDYLQLNKVQKGGMYQTTDQMYGWNELVLTDDDLKEIERLNNIKKQKNIHVVVISGPSHSGKSTLAKELENSLTANKVDNKVIGQDHYFRKDVKQRLNKNYDTPLAIDHMRLRNDIINQIETLPNDSVLIIEGFMTYFDLFIPSISDINFWINAKDPNVLAERRQKTGQNFRSIQWYLDTVWPNYQKYVEYCDDMFKQNTNLVPRTILNTDDSIEHNVEETLKLVSSKFGIQLE